MSRYLLRPLLVSIASLACAQTTGSGPTVLQNAATLNPQVFSQVRYANEFSGSDLGAQINAAASSLGTSGGVVKIPRGAYSWSTLVTIDPRIVSIVGDGSPFVTISCTASECLKLNEPTFSISQGGYIGGFTLTSNGSAGNQVGIEAGGVVGELLEDITLSGFSGSESVALLFNNSASTNGWMERTVTRKIRFDNNTVGLKFKYNTSNSNAISFGYDDLQIQCDTINSGQTCVLMANGRLYHSRIHILGNVNSGGTLISVDGTSNGAHGDMDINTYNIFAEGTGTGLSVGIGGVFTGWGTVDLPGLAITNANSPSWGPTMRVLQGPTETANGDAGAFSNFLGTGNTATIYPEIVNDIGNPYAGFGLLEGPNVVSPYASMYGGQLNAFEILQCPFNPPSMASCSSVARIDSGGNVHALGSFFANGSDYAESVEVRGDVREYERGDLLSIDPKGTNQFVKSDRAYSTTIAGIYSARPGLLGSSHALDNAAFRREVPLAINGIVPCKLSTENGPIKPGDLLVSAGRTGFAMKGTDRMRMTGAIVGKALGALNQGVGIVPVLVMLQ